jgi:formate-dependent nitrite reductase cytochrome c552 subunit
MYDEDNTHWPINMLIKTGGGDPKTGQTAGIHWHMNIGVEVDYIARDEKRLDIPWVRVKDNTTGRITVYENEDDPLSAEEVAAATPRRMDCMDCHNRPSHNFNSPDYEIDVQLLTGRIDSELPEVKRVAVEAMAVDYETNDAAMVAIANTMTDFYKDHYPDLYASQRAAVDQAIVSTQQAFSRSIFPEMKVKWSEYPDHIGHFNFPGCMRCHEGTHVSQEGNLLSRECHTCHSIMAQGSGDRREVATTEDGLDFVHPEDIGEAWKEMGCWECHSGAQP